VAYFKALFRRLPGGYEKNLDTIPEFTSSVWERRHKNPVMITALQEEIWSQHLQNAKQRFW
jgi:hypothetical protein